MRQLKTTANLRRKSINPRLCGKESEGPFFFPLSLIVSNFYSRIRIAAVLKYWITNHTSDFITEPALLNTVLEIVDIYGRDLLEGEKSKILNAMEQKR